jgi:hypothetical protein
LAETLNFALLNLNLSLTGAGIVLRLRPSNQIMRSLLLALAFVLAGSAVFAQDNTNNKKKTDWSKVDLGKRSADHFLIQFGYAGWAGAPDSLNIKGFSRTFNMYLMFDFPFKTNPRLSVAIGPGIGTDNIFFKETTIDINNRRAVEFNRDTVNKYKKYKLATGWLELPVELRWSSNPANMNSGLKFALGAKVGTLLDARTKAKVDLDENGDGGYIEKIKSKPLFNGTRLALTGRIGYGNLSVFGTYTFTEVFREGQGPQGIRPFSVGLTLSGL